MNAEQAAREMTLDDRKAAEAASHRCPACRGSGFAVWRQVQPQLNYVPTVSAACTCRLGRWIWNAWGATNQRGRFNLAEHPELAAALMDYGNGLCGEVATNGPEIIRGWVDTRRREREAKPFVPRESEMALARQWLAKGGKQAELALQCMRRWGLSEERIEAICGEVADAKA